MEKSERYCQGWEKLEEIDGKAGEKVIDGLKDISPELSRFIIEYSFGDIYTLRGLDNKSKEIAVVASLIAQGMIPQLEVHLNGALNTGSTITEVKEVILQMSVYAGFPKSINAMNAFKEVLEDRKTEGITDKEDPFEEEGDFINRERKGALELMKLDKMQVQRLQEAYKELSPELPRFILEYAYADIFSRKNLDLRCRQIATIAALTSLGNAPSQLKFHIQGGINVGMAIEEIKDIMLLMTVYSGFPSAINGMNILKEVVSEQRQEK